MATQGLLIRPTHKKHKTNPITIIIKFKKKKQKKKNQKKKKQNSWQFTPQCQFRVFILESSDVIG